MTGIPNDRSGKAVFSLDNGETHEVDGFIKFHRHTNAIDGWGEFTLRDGFSIARYDGRTTIAFGDFRIGIIVTEAEINSGSRLDRCSFKTTGGPLAA